MDTNEYQNGTAETAIYHKSIRTFLNVATVQQTHYLLLLNYLSNGLTGEAGEVASLVKKLMRDATPAPEFDAKLRKEIGDCMWYISEICNLQGWELAAVMQDNIDKLRSRKERGVLSGSGDER